MEHIYEVIIIGSGFGGIAAAVNLQKNGIEDYLMLERDEELGGTWWRNSYPGAAVDIQSHLYSLSFETYDWTRFFAKQPEILAYTKHVLSKYGIVDRALTNAEVSKLVYDETTYEWEVSLKDGRTFRSKDIINASGGLSQPSIPKFEGQDSFEGITMHTGLWDHQVNYAGKRVAVIGSAASAIQVIPAIASEVQELYVFQRTPHWIIPRPDRKLTEKERKAMRNPRLNKMYRSSIYWKHEARVLAFTVFPKLMKVAFQPIADKHIKKQIKDKELRAKVTPDYIIGCKRILLSSNYYPSLTRENVHLLTKESGIKAFNKNGIETIDGQQIDVDVIVYATGFHAAENNIPYPVIGRDGMTINESWKDYAHAYLGTTVPYFPNFYMLLGPNTGIGHTSAIYMIEAQMEYIVQALVEKRKNDWKAIEIKEQIEKDYTNRMHRLHKKTVWQSGGCKSWYQNAEGRNIVLYPTFTYKFRKECAKLKWHHHIKTK
ncbi:MAG: NAD(P)/FAD-dependent oxidoreductase [Aureispira sp.]|nr:NAD(P)/FAD-dependent oxidoreductase [Aureispira sp.]